MIAAAVAAALLLPGGAEGPAAAGPPSGAGPPAGPGFFGADLPFEDYRNGSALNFVPVMRGTAQDCISPVRAYFGAEALQWMHLCEGPEAPEDLGARGASSRMAGWLGPPGMPRHPDGDDPPEGCRDRPGQRALEERLELATAPLDRLADRGPGAPLPPYEYVQYSGFPRGPPVPATSFPLYVYGPGGEVNAVSFEVVGSDAASAEILPASGAAAVRVHGIARDCVRVEMYAPYKFLLPVKGPLTAAASGTAVWTDARYTIRSFDRPPFEGPRPHYWNGGYMVDIDFLASDVARENGLLVRGVTDGEGGGLPVVGLDELAIEVGIPVEADRAGEYPALPGPGESEPPHDGHRR